jgi:3-phosphoshikimate 1-carboxyvinyltransferase
MELRVPGDKSISQRALILATLGSGTSRIRGLLTGGDSASTASALQQLGSKIPPLDPRGAEVQIAGMGLRGLRRPSEPLDLGNSGTGARLLLGVLAGQPLEAVITGDESLRGRPMSRITDPLSAMGAHFETLGEPDRLPIRVRGGSLSAFSYRLPVASAQLKSSLLLAGLVGGVGVTLIEPGRSRDHTERMLNGLGIRIDSGELAGGWSVALVEAPEEIPPLDLDVPGDFSSASFFILHGLLQKGRGSLVIRDVGLNPTRTGLLPVLTRMGAVFSTEPKPLPGPGEPWGDLTVFPSDLKGFSLGRDEIPGLIDEVPILAVGAARAQGTSRITGAGELRVKETDRIRAVVGNLRAIGVQAEELEDGMEIQGTDRPLKGRVRSFGDHRIAMAFGILGAQPGNEIDIDEKAVAGVSFPAFWELLNAVAAHQKGLTSSE